MDAGGQGGWMREGAEERGNPWCGAMVRDRRKCG